MSKILIIDDDRGILDALKAILEFEGHQVQTLDKFENFPQIDASTPPDLVLVDFLLSGKDGKKVIGILKKDKISKNIPIIMLSAHPDAHIAAKQAGADDFIAKPFDMDYFLKKIKKHLKNQEKK